MIAPRIRLSSFLTVVTLSLVLGAIADSALSRHDGPTGASTAGQSEAAKVARSLEMSLESATRRELIYRDALRRGVDVGAAVAAMDPGILTSPESEALQGTWTATLDAAGCGTSDWSRAVSLLRERIPTPTTRKQLLQWLRDGDRPACWRQGVARALAGDVPGGADRELLAVAADSAEDAGVRRAILIAFASSASWLRDGDVPVLLGIATDPGADPALQRLATEILGRRRGHQETRGDLARLVAEGAPEPAMLEAINLMRIDPRERPAMLTQLESVALDAKAGAGLRHAALGRICREAGAEGCLRLTIEMLSSPAPDDLAVPMLRQLESRTQHCENADLRALLLGMSSGEGLAPTAARDVLESYDRARTTLEAARDSAAKRSGARK